MDKPEFDFINQVSTKSLYDLLIPSYEYGIIIFKLYEQLTRRNSDIFTENDIKLLISNRKNQEREQHEDIKDIIRDLNEFFLKPTEKGYRLTEYAKNFCRTIRGKLHEDFEPSKIEKRLISLKKSLIADTTQFNKWFEIEFDNKKVEIESQIESLERQVANAIKQFRNEILNENKNGLDLVKSVYANITIIKDQTQKLKGTLRLAEDIQQIVNAIDSNVDKDTDLTIENKQSINIFFHTIFSDFERITKRIDRVTPKLRQFYNNMSSLDYERNTRRFLNYLLANTETVGYRPLTKLQFPDIENINLKKEIYKYVHSFYYVDNEKDLYQNTKIHSHQPNKNQSIQDSQRKLTEDKIKATKDIEVFLEKIKGELEQNNEVDCEPYFIEILENTNNLNIVVKIVFKLIKEYSDTKLYQLKISNPSNHIFEGVILWKLKITKKQ